MIRTALAADLPEIARLGRRFFDQAGWGDVLEYREADCVEGLGSLLGADHFICLVTGNPICGMISGVFGPAYFNASQVIGEELFWWVDDAAPQLVGVRLLKALEAEAKARGVHAFTMKSLARLGGERMTKLYQRCGYRPSESAYIKRL